MAQNKGGKRARTGRYVYGDDDYMRMITSHTLPVAASKLRRMMDNAVSISTIYRRLGLIEKDGLIMSRVVHGVSKMYTTEKLWGVASQFEELDAFISKHGPWLWKAELCKISEEWRS